MEDTQLRQSIENFKSKFRSLITELSVETGYMPLISVETSLPETYTKCGPMYGDPEYKIVVLLDVEKLYKPSK
jgi:hypothetical protein